MPWRNLHPDVDCEEADLHYARALTYHGSVTGYVFPYWDHPNRWAAVLTPRVLWEQPPKTSRFTLFPVLAQAKAHVMKEQRNRIAAEKQYWLRWAASKEKNAVDQRQIA